MFIDARDFIIETLTAKVAAFENRVAAWGQMETTMAGAKATPSAFVVPESSVGVGKAQKNMVLCRLEFAVVIAVREQSTQLSQSASQETADDLIKATINCLQGKSPTNAYSPLHFTGDVAMKYYKAGIATYTVFFETTTAVGAS